MLQSIHIKIERIYKKVHALQIDIQFIILFLYTFEDVYLICDYYMIMSIRNN